MSLDVPLGRAFNVAIRTQRFTGSNPVSKVPKRKIPRKLPDYLRPEEVVPVLANVPDRWRCLFAAALYTGMRKGELLGLRKEDVDLGARLITIRRSHDRDTTKGGHADAVPIAAELLPYLETAIAASATDLVFPGRDGHLLSRRVQLEQVLRRALRRANILTGYRHTCCRKDCGHVEHAPDGSIRRCPKCAMKLWPVGQVRPIRFHHIRHTTASLLMMAGANPAAVQRIMRHTDPRITTESTATRARLPPQRDRSPRVRGDAERARTASGRRVRSTGLSPSLLHPCCKLAKPAIASLRTTPKNRRDSAAYLSRGDRI